MARGALHLVRCAADLVIPFQISGLGAFKVTRAEQQPYGSQRAKP